MVKTQTHEDQAVVNVWKVTFLEEPIVKYKRKQ